MFLDLAAPEMIKFGIESKFDSTATSTYAFKTAITESLLDLRRLAAQRTNNVEPQLASRL